MTDVNPPPMLRIPDSLRSNREEFGFFRQLNTILFQLWTRTGGPDDAISTVENGELYEPGIQTSDADERVDDLETDLSILQGQIEQNDEPDHDLFYSLLERVQALELDTETWARQDTEEMATENFMLEVAKGNIAGHSSVNKFGRCPDNVDSATPSDIWDGADATTGTKVWVAPTTARVHAIVSDNAADTLAGAGARTVRVYGLTSWDTAESNEDIDMDGATPVNTASSYVIIHRIKVLTKGATSVNVGIITATAATDATVTAQINASEGQTQMAIYGVPSTQVAYMTNYYCAVNRANAGSVDIELLANPEPDTELLNFQIKSTIAINSAGSGHAMHIYDPPNAFSGPCILKIRGTGSTNNMDVSAGFDLILVDN